jgi:diguanylate cyclase (GGDEF)-like protein
VTAAQGGRPQNGAGLFAVERPPRLVLRFVLVLSVAFALASALILVVVHRFAVSEAERAATRHASVVASSLLQHEVEPGDLARPVSPERRRQLDALFRPLLRSGDILGVALVHRNGAVTYATDRRAIGTAVSRERAAAAASGTIVSATGHEHDPDGEDGAKTLETYAPVRPGAAQGAALIVQSYAPVQGAARSAQTRVGGVLEALVLVLFFVFVPLLARVTKRIGAQIDRIHYQAFYDELTGLPNRSHLFERLDLALRRSAGQGRQVAVLHVDLDRFREINNTLGHETGDALLEETAIRLRAAVGGERLLARLGGDEFAIVLEYEEERDARTVAESLRAALEPPTVVGGLALAVDSTIGIAFFPKDGRDAEALLKHAEIATYTAKEWRVGVLAYSPAVDPHDPEQLELVGELREAAERGELRLHYQPKIDLATEEIVGFEALAYWNHPTRGLLPPGAFVPIAERTGAIRYVTRVVLSDAVEQLREWSSLDCELTVAVNLTAIDLLDPKLPRQLKALLRKHDVDPGRLCIELTERTVMAAPDRAKSVLKRIVAAGVQVSIDDFGTGHSSLAYLRNLPVHEVKIDRSFVSDMTVSPHDRMIVLAAIQLGHSLGLRVVAEGVETSAVHETLRELECDEAQGYLYGRPQPAEAMTDMLESGDLEAA